MSLTSIAGRMSWNYWLKMVSISCRKKTCVLHVLLNRGTTLLWKCSQQVEKTTGLHFRSTFMDKEQQVLLIHLPWTECWLEVETEHNRDTFPDNPSAVTRATHNPFSTRRINSSHKLLPSIDFSTRCQGKLRFESCVNKYYWFLQLLWVFSLLPFNSFNCNIATVV